MQVKHKKIIKTGLLIFVGLSLVSGLIQADNGPKIKFNENSWNFGNVKAGKILTHVFKFTNIGDAPLVIGQVRTSCGCAAALVSKKEIPPGKAGEIKVTFNTRGYSGELSKYVYVDSNDPKQPRKELTVSVSIEVPPRPQISLERYAIDLGLLLESEDVITQAKIKNIGELELVVEILHREASFTLKNKPLSSPLKIAAGKAADVGIKINPRKKFGLIREYILLKTNDPLRPNLSLYVSGYVVTKQQIRELVERNKDILK